MITFGKCGSVRSIRENEEECRQQFSFSSQPTEVKEIFIFPLLYSYPNTLQPSTRSKEIQETRIKEVLFQKTFIQVHQNAVNPKGKSCTYRAMSTQCQCRLEYRLNCIRHLRSFCTKQFTLLSKESMLPVIV